MKDIIAKELNTVTIPICKVDSNQLLISGIFVCITEGCGIKPAGQTQIITQPSSILGERCSSGYGI